jgi:hypothetical protein
MNSFGNTFSFAINWKPKQILKVVILYRIKLKIYKILCGSGFGIVMRLLVSFSLGSPIVKLT